MTIESNVAFRYFSCILLTKSAACNDEWWFSESNLTRVVQRRMARAWVSFEVLALHIPEFVFMLCIPAIFGRFVFPSVLFCSDVVVISFKLCRFRLRNALFYWWICYSRVVFCSMPRSLSFVVRRLRFIMVAMGCLYLFATLLIFFRLSFVEFS